MIQLTNTPQIEDLSNKYRPITHNLFNNILNSPLHSAIPSNTTHISTHPTIIATSLNNTTNFIHSSLPPITTTHTSEPPTTHVNTNTHTNTSSYQYMSSLEPALSYHEHNSNKIYNHDNYIPLHHQQHEDIKIPNLAKELQDMKIHDPKPKDRISKEKLYL